MTSNPKNLTTEELHHLIDVDFDNGVLLWKRRSQDMFSTNRSATIWNTRFAGKTNTSGHIGVSWNKRDKKWTAYITLDQKRKALGNFALLEDAIECRKQGEFAYKFHANHGRSSCSMSV